MVHRTLSALLLLGVTSCGQQWHQRQHPASSLGTHNHQVLLLRSTLHYTGDPMPRLEHLILTAAFIVFCTISPVGYCRQRACTCSPSTRPLYVSSLSLSPPPNLSLSTSSGHTRQRDLIPYSPLVRLAVKIICRLFSLLETCRPVVRMYNKHRQGNSQASAPTKIYQHALSSQVLDRLAPLALLCVLPCLGRALLYIRSAFRCHASRHSSRTHISNLQGIETSRRTVQERGVTLRYHKMSYHINRTPVDLPRV